MTAWEDFDRLFFGIDARADELTDAEKLELIEAVLATDAAYEYEGLGWDGVTAIARLVGLADEGQSWYGPAAPPPPAVQRLAAQKAALDESVAAVRRVFDEHAEVVAAFGVPRLTDETRAIIERETTEAARRTARFERWLEAKG